MNKLGVVTILLLSLSTVDAAMAKSTRVRGYVTKRGTYVAPHHRTSPDRSRANNYSTQGNVNPWTGKIGTK